MNNDAATQTAITKGQRVQITRGHQRGKTGTVNAILGARVLVSLDVATSQATANVTAGSVRAI